MQGLLRCPQCNRWLVTHYQPRAGSISGASYACRYQDGLDVVRYHLTIGTKLLDAYVVRRVLDVLQPVQIHARWTRSRSRVPSRTPSRRPSADTCNMWRMTWRRPAGVMRSPIRTTAS